MSSIYKKGRDGYYYYQAYIHNSLTGKKDKRVFYSLGTKDLNKAKEKKIYYDKKYQKSKTNYYPFIFVIPLIGIIIVSIIQINYYFFGGDSPRIKQVENKMIIELEKQKTSKLSKIELNVNLNDAIDSKKEIIDPIIPNFNIQKIDKSFSKFNQIQISLTIEEKFNKNGIKVLCQRLNEEYLNFEYLTISVYSDTKEGIMLSKGNNNNINYEMIKLHWLAMYTNNAVEGENFDNHPGRYLDLY